MENVLIYGAGKFGKQIFLDLNNNYVDKKIIGFCDINLAGEEVCGYHVFSIDQIPNTVEKIIIAIANLTTAYKVALELNKKGYNMIFYPLNKRKFYNSNDFWQENCFQFKFEGVILPHVEMHLVDFCNLNCKGCSHFSALYDKKIPDKDKRIADIYKLNEMFDTIYRLYLLGGEPLLNPDICDYVTRIRRILPTTVISIITNGLMIPSMTDEFFRCLHDNRVNVYITMYEPTKKIIDKIYDKLENFKVDHAIYSNNNGKFLRILAETKDSGMAHYCGANGCTCVCDGKISRCPQLMFVNKLNEKMQTNFPTTGIIDLNDVSDGAKLLKMLDRKVELCEYCVYSEIKWEPCGKIVKKEDFVNVLN